MREPAGTGAAPDGPMGPDDLYVHAADDGGIFVSPVERQRSAWVTLDDLSRRVEAVAAAHGRLYLSTEQGSWIAAPAVQAVMDAGVDVYSTEPLPETVRQTGVTALMSASGVGAGGLLDDLIARHADLEQRDELGRTALMYAAQRGEARSVEHLIAAGARIDATDHNGATALTLAVDRGQVEAAHILLESGADPCHRDGYGADLVGVARRKGFPRLVEMLVAAGAPAPADHGATPTAATPTAATPTAATPTAGSAGPSPGRTGRPPGRRPRDRRFWWLRTDLVISERPPGEGGLILRIVDIAAYRLIVLGAAILLVVLSVATTSSGGAILAVIVLVVGGGLSLLLNRQAVWIDGPIVQRRTFFTWTQRVDLRGVRAAHYLPKIRNGAGLQLLQDQLGSRHGKGVQRWRGLPAQIPDGPDGSPLRCHLVDLGPYDRMALARMAPYLLRPDVTLDEATRAVLESLRG